MFNKIFKKYSFLLGLILFVIILFKTNLEEILQNINHIKIVYLITTILLLLPLLIIKSLCWNYIKRKQGIKYSLKDSFLMYCSGLYIGLLTPGRIGEISKAFYLKKDGYSVGKSLVGVVIDRLTDFAFILFFIAIGSLFFATTLRKESLLLVLGVVILAIIFWISLKVGLLKWFVKKLFDKIVPSKYQESWKVNFQDFVSDIKILKIKHWLIIFLITIFSWVFYYLQIYFLAKGLGINISILYLSISATIAGLITLLPISISGIGTRDIALIALLTPIGIMPEKIIALSALILSLSLFSASIGFICWTIKPIKF